MGNSSARAILNNTVNNALSILNQSTETCETLLSQNQSINVNNCSNINISNIDFNQTGSINISCAQSASSNSSISTELQTSFKNAADSINQALDLNPGSTDAEAITNLMQNLATAIQNVYTNNCLPNIVQQQSVNATCTVQGGTVQISYLNFNQTESSISNCTQQSTSVSNIRSQIENIIDQHSSSTVQPIIAFGAIILIVIIIAIIMISSGSSGILTLIVIIVILAILIGFYFLLARHFGWWPWKPTVSTGYQVPTN